MLFNELGRNIPSVNCRVFSTEPKNFYKIDAFDTNYSKQHKLALKNSFMSVKVGVIEAEENLTEIKNLIINDNKYNNLFKATAIPFCMSIPYLFEILIKEILAFLSLYNLNII